MRLFPRKPDTCSWIIDGDQRTVSTAPVRGTVDLALTPVVFRR